MTWVLFPVCQSERTAYWISVCVAAKVYEPKQSLASMGRISLLSLSMASLNDGEAAKGSSCVGDSGATLKQKQLYLRGRRKTEENERT